jgi:hypothetical protein
VPTRLKAAAALAAVCFIVVPAPAAPQIPCDGPDADPWVADFRDRVVSYNGLAAFAAEAYGEPVSCVGGVTTEFDGVRYGTLTLTYPGGVTLEVETQPIETSVVSLRSSDGFADPSLVEGALRAYADRTGVSIDWGRSETSAEGEASVDIFRDPEPGFNASASIVTLDGRLVAVRFSMAL